MEVLTIFLSYRSWMPCLNVSCRTDVFLFVNNVINLQTLIYHQNRYPSAHCKDNCFQTFHIETEMQQIHGHNNINIIVSGLTVAYR